MSAVVAPQLQRLFNPRSIALVGASDKSWWSWLTFTNLQEFCGDVHLVNPRGGEIHGERAYASIHDVPGDIDLAYVMVPTSAAAQAMTDIAQRGIRSVVMLTAGFGETGAEGRALETQVLDIAERHGIALLGPNGNGYINATAGITPYGLSIRSPLVRGSVGIVLQSGGLASSVLDFARSHNIGVSLMVSTGNELMVSLTDVMRHLVDDPDTRVLALFIEAVRQPQEFIEIARLALERGKPVVALKAGRSVVGARAAMAHTGALVGDDAVIDAAFRQHGVVRVDTLEDLIMTSGLLAGSPRLPGRRLGVVTASGGASELICDRAEALGLDIPEWQAETRASLQELLPSFATAANPVDVTGYSLIDDRLMTNALRLAAADPGVDTLVLGCWLPSQSRADPDELRERFRQDADAIRALDKPVVLITDTVRDLTDLDRDVLDDVGLPPVLTGIDHAVTAIALASDWAERHRAAANAGARPVADRRPLDLDAGGTRVWAEHRAAAFLATHGVPVAPSILTTEPDAAAAAAARIGFPVVLKLAAEGLGHKSDIGGVRLDIRSEAEARRTFEEIRESAVRAGVEPLGVLVQSQRSGGTELIVGVVRDPSWGLVLAVGLGGVWVEVVKDSSLLVLPARRDEIRDALLRLRAADVLMGARGTKAADLDAVVDAVEAIAAVAERIGDRLESLEINPLLVEGSRVEALDALLTLSDHA